MNHVRYSLWLLWVLLSFGCIRSAGQNPLIPGESGKANSKLPLADKAQSNRHLWGLWTVQIDPITLSAIVTPDRSLDMHLNVVGLLEGGGVERGVPRGLDLVGVGS